MNFLANLFGYLLNALYNLFGNYGLAIIIFSVIVRLILIPITYKQQKSLEKNAKLQEEMKELKEKYKNNPDKLNEEIMNLYKNSGSNPLSGCFSAIVQMFIILAVFCLVKSPLTYMKKVDPQIIEKYSNEIVEETGTGSAYKEIEIINKKSDIDENVNINMNFLGVDLSKIPSTNLKDWKTFIIPILYVISSFISIGLTTKLQNQKLKEAEDDVIVVKNENNDNVEDDDSEEDMVQQMNKNMTYMIPIMSISIALVTPLGLALYWLVSNILMIIERLIIHFFMKPKEEN